MVAIVMVLLALFGVALTFATSNFAPTYWVLLVPIYGLLCIGTAYLHSQGNRHLDRATIVRQVLHWLGIGIALGLTFFIRNTGVETGEAAGMNALLLLAVGCYLAGIHLEGLFVLVGVFLTLTLVCVSKAEQYLWLIFLVGGLTLVVMFFLGRVLGKGTPRPVVGAGHPGASSS
jgi:hypothetical protein